MTHRELVAGGYGVVGRTICLELAGRDDCCVVAAGRSLDRAVAFACLLYSIRRTNTLTLLKKQTGIG